MSLTKVKKLFTASCIGALAVMLAMVVVNSETLSNVLFAASLLILGAGVLIWGIFWRCPSCGRHMGRISNGRFCPYCGHELEIN